MHSKNLTAATAFIFSIAVANFANAQTTWTGNVDTQFHTAGNWSNGVPNASTNTTFDLSGSHTIDFSADGQTNRVDWKNGDFTMQGAFQLTTGRAQIFNGADVTFSGINAATDRFELGDSTGTSGGITISNGSQLTSTRIDLAYYDASSALATVTGPGSSWVSTGGLNMGVSFFSRSGGTLEIRNGGQVQVTQILAGDGGDGIIRIDGQDSKLLNFGTSRLGTFSNTSSQGGADLQISNGGYMFDMGATLEGEGDVNVNISGPGSQWESAGSMAVAAHGNIRITNQGSIKTGNAEFSASGSTDQFEILVQGNGSKWNSSGNVQVGSQGTTRLVVDTGLFAADGSLSNNTGSSIELFSGRMELGSYLSNGGTLTVDNSELRLSDGASSFGGNDLAWQNSHNSGIATLSLIDTAEINTQRLFVGGDSLTAGNAGVIGVLGTGKLNASAATTVWDQGRLIVDGGTVNTAGITNQGAVEIVAGTIDNSSSGYVQANGMTRIGGGVLQAGQLSITGGSIRIEGGQLNANYSSLHDFDSIQAVSGSMTGKFTNAAGVDLDLAGVSSTGIGDTFNAGGVTIENSGTLSGSGRLIGSLDNKDTGTIRVGVGQNLKFGTLGASHVNRGVLSAIGNSQSAATVEFNSELTNAATGAILTRNSTLHFDAGLGNEGSIGFSFGVSDVFGDIENTGTISIGGGAEVTFYDDVVQNGQMVVAKSGTRTSAAVLFGSFSGGGFTGGGDVFALGDLRPGYSPASIVMDGNLLLGATTSTSIELGGLGVGEFDQMLISGDFSIDGQLLVSLYDGFELGAGQEFLIADVGGLQSGAFAALGEGDQVGIFSGHKLFITYAGGDGNDVVLFSAVPEPSSLISISAIALALVARRRRRNVC